MVVASPMALILKRVFWVSLICSFLCLKTLSLSCDSGDLVALKQFASNLTSGTIISVWANSSDCCQWEGVLCNVTENGSDVGKVTGLNLQNKGLTGQISGSIGELNQLKLLDLSSNRLEGLLPADLSKLKQLVSLDISNNSLSGSVMEAFSGLENLQSMNISSNLFNGTLSDFGIFPDLAVFNISNNSFTGPMNPQICESSKIQVIDVSMNRLTGDLQSLYNCSSSLKQLHINANSFAGQIPAFVYSMSSLEQLTMAGNNFSGFLSQNLGNLSSLKILVLAHNQISGPLPNIFSNLTLLVQFIAHSNFLSGPLPSSLARCKMLQILDLRNNSFTGPIDIDFTDLTNLSVLDLATNHLIGPLPTSLSSCQKLKILNLAKNKLGGEVPKEFGELASLSFLSLSNNSFVNLSSALSTLQKCNNLTTLILTKNFHGETLPSNLTGFSSLVVFALGNCGLNGRIPNWLLNCTELQVLDLSWNIFQGLVPPWIGKMDKLFYLDLSNNTLTGEIPQSLTQLKRLVSSSAARLDPSVFIGTPLYVKRNQSAKGLQYNQPSNFPPSILLSNNKLNGTIPVDFGRLKQLHVLDLSRNIITGAIPESVSNLSNLEVLDLSHNDLTGLIPPSIVKLNFLSRFSVAFNHLQGQIPTKGQFLSFSNSSYDGNPGLCGTPLLSPCGVLLKPAFSSHSAKFRSSVLCITISVGIGIALLFATILIKVLRRDSGSRVDYVGDEPKSSEVFLGFSSKLELFQNSECKELTVDELLKSTDNFSQANIIGCGGFGLVYKATLPNNTNVAIKRMSGECCQMEREFHAEVEALSRAQHENLVTLQGYCEIGNDRLLIYTFMENGSLDYWLHESVDENSVLNWSTRLKIAQGAGHGLAYLHTVCDPNIIHRDIKSSNILLNENFEAHLADFGLSRLLHPYDTHVTTDLVGTLGYIPPEYSQSLAATIKGDVYSFGVVLLELLTGRRPVEVCKGKNCRDLVSWVFQMKAEKKEELVIDASIWKKDDEKKILEVLEIACKCLDQDPKRRPSIEQVASSLDAVAAVH